MRKASTLVGIVLLGLLVMSCNNISKNDQPKLASNAEQLKFKSLLKRKISQLVQCSVVLDGVVSNDETIGSYTKPDWMNDPGYPEQIILHNEKFQQYVNQITDSCLLNQIKITGISEMQTLPEHFRKSAKTLEECAGYEFRAYIAADSWRRNRYDRKELKDALQLMNNCISKSKDFLSVTNNPSDVNNDPVEDTYTQNSASAVLSETAQTNRYIPFPENILETGFPCLVEIDTTVLPIRRCTVNTKNDTTTIFIDDDGPYGPCTISLTGDENAPTLTLGQYRGPCPTISSADDMADPEEIVSTSEKADGCLLGERVSLCIGQKGEKVRLPDRD